jgi:GT2 family glycosyltransferase
MSELPSISVVIPSYNRGHALGAVLRPLMDDPTARELIVVIDGSTDDSLQVIQALARIDPRVVALPIANSGEMAAREAGARVAGGEIVLFLDDDVLAEPGLVTGHAARHAAGGADVVLGYMPVELDGRPTAEDFASRIYAREYEGRCLIFERDPISVLRELWAGNFSMRRDACLAVGMPNPRYTARYHPDRDFGLRCLEAGLTGVFDRSLRARHLHSRPLAAFIRDARSQGAARVLMQELHAGQIPAMWGEEFERGLPSPAARLVRLGRRPRAGAALAGGLSALVRAAGRVRAWPAQLAAARLLRRLEQQRGAIEETRVAHADPVRDAGSRRAAARSAEPRTAAAPVFPAT